MPRYTVFGETTAIAERMEALGVRKATFNLQIQRLFNFLNSFVIVNQTGLDLIDILYYICLSERENIGQSRVRLTYFIGSAEFVFRERNNNSADYQAIIYEFHMTQRRLVIGLLPFL